MLPLLRLGRLTLLLIFLSLCAAKAAVASANAASASNNDDLQQEMQRIFRPEKLMAQFKAYLSSTATDYYNKNEDETKSTLPTLDDCSKSLLPLLDALMNQTKSTPEWVVRMLDATGKLGLEGGFFDGNMAAFGDFDECLRIDVAESIITINVTGVNVPVKIPAFKGQYTTNRISLVPLNSKKYDAEPFYSESSTYQKSFRHNNGLSGLRHQDYGLEGLSNSTLTLDFLDGLKLGPAYVGICLPSTCNATKLENFLNEKLNETLGGLFKPMGSKIVDEIKDAVYTSEPRPFTTGDIVTIILLVIIISIAMIGALVDIKTKKQYGNQEESSWGEISVVFFTLHQWKKVT